MGGAVPTGMRPQVGNFTKISILSGKMISAVSAKPHSWWPTHAVLSKIGTLSSKTTCPFLTAAPSSYSTVNCEGLTIREKGRIGAEKIFNYIRRFDKGDTRNAIVKAVEIIKKRTRYIRGMNIIMVNDDGIFVSSYFTEDDRYFTMKYREGRELVICSAPFPGEKNWHPIANRSMRVW
jgi:hypothetical protein